MHDIRRYGCHLLQDHLFPERVRNESALNSTYTCTDGELNLQSCHSLYSLPFIITFLYLIVKKGKMSKKCNKLSMLTKYFACFITDLSTQQLLPLAHIQT